MGNKNHKEIPKEKIDYSAPCPEFAGDEEIFYKSSFDSFAVDGKMTKDVFLR